MSKVTVPDRLVGRSRERQQEGRTFACGP